MKVAFVVLLLAAVVMAGEDNNILWPAPTAEKLTGAWYTDSADCLTREDCQSECNLRCYVAGKAMCVDARCFCEVQYLGPEKRRFLKNAKKP